MDEHKPTTEHIRFRYWAYGSPVPEFLQPTAEHVAGAAFDRWLAEHDRALSEKVWDECELARAKWMQDQRYYSEDEMPNPYRITEENN